MRFIVGWLSKHLLTSRINTCLRSEVTRVYVECTRVHVKSVFTRVQVKVIRVILPRVNTCLLLEYTHTSSFPEFTLYICIFSDYTRVEIMTCLISIFIFRNVLTCLVLHSIIMIGYTYLISENTRDFVQIIRMFTS